MGCLVGTILVNHHMKGGHGPAGRLLT
jgi:hypothetical protein